MDDLKDKAIFIKNLKMERINKWNEHNDYRIYDDTTFSLAINNRFKYLLYGILGEKLTHLLISKIG